MDTKLKSNKSAQRTAVVIVALAATCFALVALNCKNQADSYYGERSSDFESSLFVDILFQNNYVLYTELLEKSGKRISAENLYLSFEEKTIPDVQMGEYFGTEIIYQGTSEQLRAEQVSELHNSILRINSLYTTELGMNMDYCVIDGETQVVLKNTTRDIELLAEKSNPGYVYYLIIYYDKNGSISDMRVCGTNSEQFLKNAQLVANSSASRLLDDKQKVTSYAIADTFDNVIDKTVTITQKSPQNATFIYAMTKDQMENFIGFPIYHMNDYGRVAISYYIGLDSKETIYERIGVGRYYLFILAIITVIFGLLARYMPQRVADTISTRWCVELILVIQWVLAVGLYMSVIRLVYMVNEKYSPVKQINFVILFGAMFLLFGAWYWCLLGIRGIFGGMRCFIKKRSLIYKYGVQFKEYICKIRSKWEKALASVDLGKDLTRFLKRLVLFQFLIISLVCCCWIFGIFIMIVYSVILYWSLKRYISKLQIQYKRLMQATHAIAQGKFDNTFEGDFGIFESYKEELYQIQGGFGAAVEEEVRSQRMRTELITNVSHDLKTPLTAIITYIDLLKDKNITEEQKQSYLKTLERKSLRLKDLIEDLFEISKASSGNVKFELIAVDICNLIRQVYLEHEDKMKENGLEVRFDLPKDKIILQLDSQKTYRIFQNLYINISKYAMPNTRVYVQLKVILPEDERDKTKEGYNKNMPVKKVHIELKNISEQELTVNPTDLTERFVRGDTSRNTEGSGLGLAIAKSFTELQGGKFRIEIDGDLFKAILEWEEKLDEKTLGK